MNKCILSLLLGFMLCLQGCPNPDQKRTSSKKNQNKLSTKEVIATVGKTYVITQKAFLKRYKKLGAGVDPQLFLQRMIDEKLLLIQAQKNHLRTTPYVQKIWRKALSQGLLKYSFEKTYNPNSINQLEVRKAYNARRYMYVQPNRVQAWHILVRLPNSVLKEDSATRKKRTKLEESWSQKERKERRESKAKVYQRALQLAWTIQRAVEQKKPTTGRAFQKIAFPFVRQYNRPISALRSWFKEFHELVKDSQNHPAQRLAKALQPLQRKLHKMYYCDMCIALDDHIQRHIRLFSKSTKLPSPKELSQFYTIARRGIQQSIERVRVRNLGAFSYQSMLEPFAKAAFSIPNKAYTHKPIRTKYGYHIIFRSGFIPASSVPFEKVAPSLRKALYTKRASKLFRRWLYHIKKKYEIKRFYTRLKTINKSIR